jgi:phospholipase/carboxylesterase
MNKYLSFVFLIFFFSPILAFSQDNAGSSINKDQNIVYFDAPSFHKCIVVLPKNYDTNKKYPLIVGLHGRYADAEYAMSLLKQLGIENAILAAPQGPYHEGEKGKYSWAISDNEVKGIWTESKNTSQKYIAKIVGEISKAYSVDTKQVFLLGHSQGAAMSYGVGIKNPELFKGIIVLSGWLDPDWITEDEVKKANKLMIFIGHGKNDDVVRFVRSTEARDLLKKNGNSVTAFEYDGGHGPQEDELKAAAEWLRKNISADDKGKQ